MNPHNNGNDLRAENQEGSSALLDRQEITTDGTPSPQEPQASVASSPWATRVDALKTATTNRKPMVLLGAGLGAAIVLFVITSFFGKPPSKKLPGPMQSTQAGLPSKQKGSVTPLMDTARNPTSPDTGGQVTPADISRTKASSGNQNPPPPPQTTPSRSSTTPNTTLAGVPPFESTQQHWEEPKPYGEPQPPAGSSTPASQQNLLKEASLVFVKKTEQANGSVAPNANQNNSSPPELIVTPGTRIQARLETQVSSAVSAPVVAVVEYTYSLGDHIVIPAGARVYGQLQQADRSGAISIKFNELELLDGDREKIEAIGTSLELGPIKGVVSGKNTGRNFLVRTASGIGSVAAMLVGNNSSSAFSEDDLIRQRIAENVGNAGDTEIMNMALTNRVVVSVPADTPIYIVFTKRSDTSAPASLRSSSANP